MLAAILAIVSLAAQLGHALDWTIVAEPDPPVALAENVMAMRRELSELLGQEIAMRSATELTDEERKHNLIVVGRFAHQHYDLRTHSFTIAQKIPDDQIAKSQGYVVMQSPLSTERTTIAAMGWEVAGAVYAVSHLRTHLRLHRSQLRLDANQKLPDNAAYQEMFVPAFAERGVYYNLAFSRLGRQTPLNWNDDDWRFWIDKIVCSQLTHIYFFLWSDSLYFPWAPETSGDDNRVRHETLKRMIRYAHKRGLKVCYLFTPTTVPPSIFEANRATISASIVYAEHGFPVVCSAVTDSISYGNHSWSGTAALMKDIYQHQLEQFQEADQFQLWFYDPGGCFCGPQRQNCRAHQTLRLMEQLDYYHSLAKRLNPACQFEVSLWPVWALEADFKIRYRDGLLHALAQFRAAENGMRHPLRISDSVTNPDTTLLQAQELGIETNGFIFPTNVETGCSLLIPMVEFLHNAVKHAQKARVSAIHHMRIEENMKFANTYFASRFYWDPNQQPHQVVEHYAGWVANSNPEAARQLAHAIQLLDQFMSEGSGMANHSETGVQIEHLIESALQGLGETKRPQLEWLATTAKAVQLIGRAIDNPEEMEELTVEFVQVMESSPTFRTSTTPLSKYVAWVSKGWKTENF